MKIKMPVIQTNTTATTTNNNNNSNKSNSNQSSNKKKKIMERNGFPGSRGPGIKKRSYQSDSIQNNKTKQKNKNKKKIYFITNICFYCCINKSIYRN